MRWVYNAIFLRWPCTFLFFSCQFHLCWVPFFSGIWALDLPVARVPEQVPTFLIPLTSEPVIFRNSQKDNPTNILQSKAVCCTSNLRNGNFTTSTLKTTVGSHHSPCQRVRIIVLNFTEKGSVLENCVCP